MTTDFDTIQTLARAKSPYLPASVGGSNPAVAVVDCDGMPGRSFGANRGLESTVAA